MYEITEYKKKMDFTGYNYIFKKFSDFYELADCLTVSLLGVIKILILSNNIEDITSFIREEYQWKELVITIACEQNSLSYIQDRDPSVKVKGQKSSYVYFTEQIAEKQVYFDKYVASKLYATVEHDNNSINEALDLCVATFGKLTLIKEKDLATIFVINDIVYPRQVLYKFITMDRYRWNSLNKCTKQIDNDIIVGSFVKNLKKLVETKANFFRTGVSKNQERKLNTSNIMLLYRIFVLEREGVNDAYLLLKMYELGASSKDIKEKRENVYF